MVRVNRLGGIWDRRPPHRRGVENGLGNSGNVVNWRVHAGGARRSRRFRWRIRLNLEVVLVDRDRSRQLIGERIEGIPLGIGFVGDEDGERNAGP